MKISTKILYKFWGAYIQGPYGMPLGRFCIADPGRSSLEDPSLTILWDSLRASSCEDFGQDLADILWEDSL